MLFKFKSKNTGDIIMLQAHGQHVLEIIGKDVHGGSADKGIILHQQIPAAIAALQAAVADEEAARKAAVDEAAAKGEPAPHFAELGLRQRAQPFVEMLKRCAQSGDDVVWGV